jgi:beta-phosphoglucomutase-like phosphatase (HAD superfamily)
MKPEPEIFARAIAQFGVSPETTVYVDDVTVHIEAGRRAGLHAVQYDLATHGEFLAALQQLGVTGV